jgi:hypothetical protein
LRRDRAAGPSGAARSRRDREGNPSGADRSKDTGRSSGADSKTEPR